MKLPEDFQFSHEFEVGSFQVHPDGEIRMFALADLLQEIAWRHADSGDFGRSLLENQQMWVLSRFEIKVYSFPKWGDKIRIFTGGRGAEKLFAFREFMVWDEKENVLARAMSSWLLLHTQTKRIQKPDSVLPKELFDPLKKPIWQPEKLSFMGNLIGEEEIKVQHSDLDLNHHVNNTSYIRWVENSLSEFGEKAREISMNYLSECHAGDRIALSVAKLGEEIFVLGESNTKPVFLAKTKVVKD